MKGQFLRLCQEKKANVGQHAEKSRRAWDEAKVLLDDIVRPLVEEIGFERMLMNSYWHLLLSHSKCKPGRGIVFHIETGKLCKGAAGVSRWREAPDGSEYKINIGDEIDPEPSTVFYSGHWSTLNRFINAIHDRLAVMCVDKGLVK